MFSVLIWIFSFVTFIHLSNGIDFLNVPSPEVNEDDDGRVDLWPLINATCDVTVNGTNGTEAITTDCNTCDMSAGSADLFEVVGLTLSKKMCTDSGCGVCPSCGGLCTETNGCLTYNDKASYDIEVTCRVVMDNLIDDGAGSTLVTLTVTPNAPLILSNLPESEPANNGMAQNAVIFTAAATDPVFDWELSAGVVPSWNLGTLDLFQFNTGNGEVYVNAPLADEYSYPDYYMTICAYDRRTGPVCADLAIPFDGCFQMPTCTDQLTSIVDTITIGSSLFSMTIPDPTDHFSLPWAGLGFTIVTTTTADGVVGIDPSTGEITTSGNITVHPDYPKSYHTIVVEVGNSASCSYVSQCTMNFDVEFTNWLISIQSLDTSVDIDEDDDLAKNLHRIITYDNNNPDHDNVTCVITTNPDESLFTIISDGPYAYDSWSIWKNACETEGCGFDNPCPSNKGCMVFDSVDTYDITVQCFDGYGSDDSATLTVNLIENPAPTISVPASATADRQVHVIGDVIYTTTTNEPLEVTWRRHYIEDSWLLNTTEVFDLDEGTHANAEVSIKKSLDLEYSYNFTMNICVRDRRSEVCGDLLIQLSACFQRPTCDNQDKPGEFADTYIGSLFDMIVPLPSFHFVHISTVWQQLSYVMKYSSLDVALLDSVTGNLYNSDNITVWPNYTHSYHTIILEIRNSESCDYTSLCTMTFDVEFINWPISFDNLPATVEINEDFDLVWSMIDIVAYDYNNVDHDNVTCDITNNPDVSLWEIHHDGGNGHRSWSIWKRNCSEPECGFLCDLGIGCMNYDLDDTYAIEITCHDAYTSSVTAILTVNLIENVSHQLTNLPATIVLDSNRVTEHDILFSTIYTDNENEVLNYNYSITPDQPDPLLFAFDGRGNYFNDLANITAVNEQWTLTPVIYYLYICGTERRNIQCATLTIDIRDYCTTTPTCTSDSSTQSDQLASDSTLFTVNGAGNGILTYAITSSKPDLFNVDSSGVITSTAPLPASYPYTRYSINGFVYDSTACEYAVCTYDLTVTFTNYDITIPSLPSTESIPEDTTTEVILHMIVTQDANADDTVDCSVNADAANNDIFFTEATAADPNAFMILSKAGYNFDYHNKATQYIVRVTCRDAYGSSATGVLTVDILENQAPVISNLIVPVTRRISPFVVLNGATLFTIVTSDPENDPLTIDCSVADSMVPLQCNDAGVISLRRDVTFPRDEGTTYSIEMCVHDAKHDVCGTFSVIPTINETAPILDLPATVLFGEDTAAGTWLYNVTYNDPDVGEAHTFSIAVSPSTAATMFDFDTTTGVLALTSTSTFNYEDQSVYTFTFYVSDPYLDSAGPAVLTLNVGDVNEPPVFTLTTTVVTTVEGDAGLELATVVFTCEDPDTSQTPVVSISAGTHMTYFAFDDPAGKLSYALNWDLEAGQPLTTWITLTCDDGNGLVDSANVTINVEPVNEFYPVVDSAAHVSIDINNDDQAVHIPLYNFTATDLDYGDDGVFLYDVLGVGEGKKYFTMVSSGNVGKLMLRNFISLSYNKTFKFTIYVQDEDVNPLKTYVKITANYMVYITTVPATEPTYCTTCTTTGKVVVGVLAAEGLIVVAIVIHIIVRFTSTAGSSLGQTAISKLVSQAPAAPHTQQSSTRQDAPRHNQQKHNQQKQNQQRKNQQLQNQQRRDDDRISIDSDDSDFSVDDDVDDRRRRFQQRAQPQQGPANNALPRPVYSSQTVPSYNARPVHQGPPVANSARAPMPNPVYSSNQTGYMTFNTAWGH